MLSLQQWSVSSKAQDQWRQATMDFETVSHNQKSQLLSTASFKDLSQQQKPRLHTVYIVYMVQLLLSHNSWLTLCYFLSFCFFWMLFSTQGILRCYTSKSNTRCYSETLMLFFFLRHPTVGNSPGYSVTQHHHDRRCKKKGRHSHVSEKGNFIFIGTVRCQWQRNEQNRQALRLYLSRFCAAFR